MSRRRHKAVSDQIREAIDASSMTRRDICILAEVDESVMSRFMSGERGLSTPVLDAIGKALKLEITSAEQRRTKA